MYIANLYESNLDFQIIEVRVVIETSQFGQYRCTQT